MILHPRCIVLTVVFTGTKFNIFNHNHDAIYHDNCPEHGCPDNYVGETAKRISERVLHHTGKYINNHFIKTLLRQVIKL